MFGFWAALSGGKKAMAYIALAVVLISSGNWVVNKLMDAGAKREVEKQVKERLETELEKLEPEKEAIAKDREQVVAEQALNNETKKVLEKEQAINYADRVLISQTLKTGIAQLNQRSGQVKLDVAGVPASQLDTDIRIELQKSIQ